MERDLTAYVELAEQRQTNPVDRRLCFAAAHIAFGDGYEMCGHSEAQPGSSQELAGFIDWDTTAEIRSGLDRYGFGIAEAMDTAQRFELGWEGARRLIELCGELDLAQPWVAGAGSDQLGEVTGLAVLVDAVVEQVEVIQTAGGHAVLLPQVWLVGRGEEATVDFYSEVVQRVRGPLVVHWLGEMFAPALRGYFPGDSFRRVMELDPSKIRGAKISLLDQALEIRLRCDLASRDQLLFTGDDWNFPTLIGGSGSAKRTVDFGDLEVGLGDFSHALLGILGPVARPASVALELLAAGCRAEYDQLMDPCAEIGKLIFEEPTRHYKAGVAFVSYLNGRQGNPLLANHLETQRSREHYVGLARLCFEAGAFDSNAAASDVLMKWEQKMTEAVR